MFGTLTVGVVTLGAVVAGVVTAGVLMLGTVTLGTVAGGPDVGHGILGGPVTGGSGVGVEGTGDDGRASGPPALALVPSRALTSAVAGALAGGEPTAADRRTLAGGSTHEPGDDQSDSLCRCSVKESGIARRWRGKGTNGTHPA